MQKSSQTLQTQNGPTQQALYQKTILGNGIRVVSETIPYVRSVSVGVWANVGSRDESGSENGLSHFLEHMVFKGTKSRSVREIAQSLESLGGYLNAFTTKEQTCFYARVLDEHTEQAIDVLSDLVQHATFRKKELEKEKLVVIEELKNAEDDPEDIIHDYFEKILFPTHPLGFPIIGTEQNLRSFTRQDLQVHVAEHYTLPNFVVAAAGNIDHAKLVRLTEKISHEGKAITAHCPPCSGPDEARQGRFPGVHQADPTIAPLCRDSRVQHQTQRPLSADGYECTAGGRNELEAVSEYQREAWACLFGLLVRELVERHGIIWGIYRDRQE